PFRNVPDQPGEPVPNFLQVRGEAILATSLPQLLQRGVRPAVAFPAPVTPGQLPKHPLRAAGGLVVLARRQFVAPLTGVEAQRPSLCIEWARPLVVLRVDPTDPPGSPLHDGQANDDDRPAVVLASGLVQADPPFRLVVLIADQQ